LAAVIVGKASMYSNKCSQQDIFYHILPEHLISHTLRTVKEKKALYAKHRIAVGGTNPDGEESSGTIILLLSQDAP
jgi:hypothetical protein